MVFGRRWSRIVSALQVRSFLLVAAVVGGMPLLGVAQGIITGSINGTVVDETGAVIPSAKIHVVNESTGAAMLGTSNQDGSFLIADVPLGGYEVTIEAQGFNANRAKHVQVVAGNVTSLGRQMLKLGHESQTIEVDAGASELVNKESAQGEVAIESQQLESLPVNGGMDNAVLVVPGVVQTHADGMSNTNGVNYSVNGERGRSNNSEIDGQSNNDNSVTGPQFFFSNQDAVQEIQVITNNFSAQYGRNMGSIVNYITKNGTNTFHGSAFEYYLGSWGSSLTQGEKGTQFGFCGPSDDPASGCAPATIARFVQNNFGGTLGGPILKDKLFFFGSTYWDRTYQGALTFTSAGSVFPDAAGLKTLQETFPNNPGAAALALNGPYAYPAGNPTPYGTPTTIPVTDGVTVANVEVAEVKRGVPNYVHDQEHLGRIDYQVTPKDRVYARYMYQNNPFVPAGGNFAAGGYYNVDAIVHSVGGDWTRTLSPRVVNQLRYSFQQAKLAFDGGGVPECTIANFSACPSRVRLGAGLLSIGYPTNLPEGRVVKVTQVQDNASVNHGRQTIQFGGEWDYQNSPNVYLPNAIGSFNFAPGATSTPFRGITDPAMNNGITGMLEGITETSLTAGSPTVHFTEPDFAVYFQDDWKVRHDLTLNLGIRYEFFGQSINLLHDESMAQQSSAHPLWSNGLPSSVTTFPKVNPYYKNIEPRIGFAWSPAGLSNASIHGGFAINVDPAFDNIFINIATGVPLVNAGTFACDGVAVNCLPNNGLTYGTVQAADAGLIPTGGDPRLNGPYQTVPKSFKNPMAETYTLGIQYQVGKAGAAEVRYVGNHTFRQFQSLNTNPDIASVRSSFPGYGQGQPVCQDSTAFGYGRSNCDFGLVQTVANTAFSIYNGLQTSFTARNFHHWTGTVSYTFSRTIDNTSEIFSTNDGGNTSAYAQDPLNSNVGERGVSGISYPNVVGLQLNFTEPWFQDQRALRGRLLGGYFFNSLYTYNTGQPFTPEQDLTAQSPFVDATDAMASTSFCDFGFGSVYGQSCRPILSNRRAPINTVGVNTGKGYVNYVTGEAIDPSSVHWLWNNQYEAIARHNPFPGVGRNTLRGDSFNNLDLTVGKNVRLTERLSALLQISAFNALNRGYYGTPDPNIEDSLLPTLSGVPAGFLNNYYASGGGESPAAGGAFPSGPGNRSVQLSGKIVF